MKFCHEVLFEVGPHVFNITAERAEYIFPINFTTVSLTVVICFGIIVFISISCFFCTCAQQFIFNTEWSLIPSGANYPILSIKSSLVRTKSRICGSSPPHILVGLSMCCNRKFFPQRIQKFGF